MDSSRSHWSSLSGLRPKNRRKNDGRGKREGFRWAYSGGLRGICRAAPVVSGERKELDDFRTRHFSRISLGMPGKLRNRTKQTQKCPKKWYFGHFWPSRAVWEALKTPLEVRVERETCRTIHGTHLECILSPKKFDRVGRGGQKRSKQVGIWLLAHPMENTRAW